MTTSSNTIEQAFPKMESGFMPFGEKVLIQLRCFRRKTASGIVLPEDTRDFNQSKVSSGLVVALGPLAYHNIKTGEAWPEGNWASVGDIVRVPIYGGDRWSLPHPEDPQDRVYFAVVRDVELAGRIDPAFFESIDLLI